MITQLSAVELGRRLSSRQLSAKEVTLAFLDRIKKLDESYGSFLLVDHDGALNAANDAQRLTVLQGETDVPQCPEIPMPRLAAGEQFPEPVGGPPVQTV